MVLLCVVERSRESSRDGKRETRVPRRGVKGVETTLILF